MVVKDLEKNFVSAVIYVHNYRIRLEPFLNTLIGELKSHFEDFELIFVDDYSIDDSMKVIKDTVGHNDIKALSIIHLSYYHGVEASMIAGLDMAIGDFVFEFDSPVIDYQSEEIMNVYYQSLLGFDLVSASPNKNERWLSKIFYKIFRQYSKNRIQLSTERFRIVSRRGINRISILSSAIPYRKAIYNHSGLKSFNHKYTPITNDFMMQEKIDERFTLAIDSLLLFTDIGARVALYLTSLMGTIAVGGALYAILIYMFNQQVVEGWTTTMLFLSISFSGLFLLMGIVIKYASMILYMQNQKQPYVIESIEKL